MGERDGQECIVALSLSDGHELWLTPVGKTGDNGGYPGPRSTPTTDDNRVYALGTRGDLVCCDATTGKILWRKNLEIDFGGSMMSGWGFSESPLVDGEKLVCTPGAKNAMLVALNKLSGAEIWRCSLPDGKAGAGYSSIVVSNGAGKKQYVQLVGQGLIGVSADDGKFLWTYRRVANSVANIATPIVRGDYVFASTAYDAGSALVKLAPTATGGVNAEEVYFIPARTFQNHHGGMVLVGDYLYAGHGQKNGFPICIDWKTGRVIWGEDKRCPGAGSADVTYADGRLYFRYEDGTVALIGASPKEYTLYGTFKIPDVTEPSWPPPVIAGGKLYLREQDALYCYNLK
jgi:outer membrane protein assembly factor BamB